MTTTLPSARPAAVRQPSAPTVERVAAAVAVAALGVQKSVVDGISVGVVVAVLLIPVWVTSFRRYRGGDVVVWLVVAALANGLLLAAFRGGRGFDHHEAIGTGSLLVQFGVGVGVVLWARDVLGSVRVAVWLGVGLTLWGLANADPGTNVWKYAIGMPVSVLLLSLAALTRRTWVSLAAILLLVAASLASDSRAFFAALLLCGLVFVWSRLPGFTRSRNGWAGVVLMLLAVSGAMYLLLSQLLVSGVLGTAAAERSQAQISESGSLILGGRPEIAATWALVEHRPAGFGLGVEPSQPDVNAAKAGMLALNYNPNNGYVENYMFGGRFELHSVVGDLYATTGFAGVLLTVAILGYTLFVIGRGVATRSGSAVVFFAAVWTLWNLPFSPLVGAIPVLTLMVGLSLDPRTSAFDRLDGSALGSVRRNRAARRGPALSQSSRGTVPAPVREER